MKGWSSCGLQTPLAAKAAHGCCGTLTGATPAKFAEASPIGDPSEALSLQKLGVEANEGLIHIIENLRSGWLAGIRSSIVRSLETEHQGSRSLGINGFVVESMGQR